MKVVFVSLLTIAAVYAADAYMPPDLESGLRNGLTPTLGEVEDAVAKAREINLLKRGINLVGRNYTSRSVAKCPLSLHHGTRQLGDAKISSKANDALLAVRTLMNDGGYSLEDLQHENVKDIFKRVKALSCDVPQASKCKFRSTFRNADGSCNNRRNPEWGMTGSVQRRVLPNDYDDNIGLPRTKGFKGRPLPNPRTVSNQVHCNPSLSETLSDRLTLHVMGFGQFLDHDIARTPEQEVVEDCCERRSRKDEDNCFNIIVPKSNDESSPIFVPGFCMEVKRSAPVFCPDAASDGIPIRQQTTILTSFVDASNVYGSSAARQAELRENGNGFRMKTIIFDGQERLPDGPDDTCTLTNSSQSCSAAGDARVNEVPTLTSYHFLFVKEHNRIADILKDFYDDDETIFQETRRIVIAIMQKIVYDEFLPSFLSPGGLQENQLQSSAKYVYNRNIDPTMLNAFGIAFRVGHTWVPQRMRLFSRSLNAINTPGFTLRTENVFNNPKLTYQSSGFERLAYFLSGSQSPETDRVLEEAIRSRLFLDTDNQIAFDLAALNIQRGRDHGLPSYNEYRKWCGLSSVRSIWSFYGNSGLKDHTLQARIMLKNAGYRSPLDIDLFVGGLTETPLSGGNLGPTFECIIGRQFQRLKFGDRLWYQNKDAGFTDDQIAAVQKYSLSKVLCNNYNFQRVHFPSAFESRNKSLEGGNGGHQGWTGSYYPSYYWNYWPQYPGTNARDTLTSCADIPDLDLSLFQPRKSKKSEVRSEITEELEKTFGIKEQLERVLEEMAEVRQENIR